MIHLETKDFKNLLSDIYTAFAPQNLDGVDNLVEKYEGSEMTQRNAIQMAFIKYVNTNNPNFQKFSHILPEVGTERNIMFLMESYARGERMFTEDTLNELKKKEEQERMQAERKLEEERVAKEEAEAKKREEEEEIKRQAEMERLRLIKETSKKNSESLSEELQEATKLIEGKYSKVIEELTKKVQDLSKSLYESNKEEQVGKSAFEEMDLEIISFEEPGGKDAEGNIQWQISDINTIDLPPKKYVATLSIGQRFMTPDKSGRIVGVEVVNITDDYVSDPEKPIRMMNLRKV